MRIGILGCFYGCAELLPRVMEPWLALKNEGYDVVFGAINVQFTEYAELGYKNDDESTRAALEENRALFDPLLIAKKPMREHEARTLLLNELLAQNVDLIWILDGDEVYTIEQIKNSIQFVEKTPFDYYHIYFDNRIFDDKKWNDTFAPPRIFRTNRHGGIKEFTWDNEVEFRDGTNSKDIVSGMVPKKLAYVLHYTWRREGAEKKIQFHKKHYDMSMYVLNEKNELDVNPAYFNYYQLPLPQRLPDGSFAASKRPILDVVMRTHSTGNFRPEAQRVSDGYGGRHELSIRSLRSLIHSLLVLERADEVRLRFTVIDDHSSKEFLNEVEDSFKVCPFETTLINLQNSGNAASMAYALEYAREHNQDFVYFVEDDYLHEPTELLEMIWSWRIFTRNLRRTNVALFPVDYSDFYLPGAIAPTRVVKGSRRHWRVSYSTTATFFVPKPLLEEQWQWFIKNPADNMSEGESLNVVWRQHATLFSPIPTLAIHLHGEDLLPPFSNWRRLWDTVREPLYDKT